jgi:hypothetical protein
LKRSQADELRVESVRKLKKFRARRNSTSQEAPQLTIKVSGGVLRLLKMLQVRVYTRSVEPGLTRAITPARDGNR